MHARINNRTVCPCMVAKVTHPIIRKTDPFSLQRLHWSGPMYHGTATTTILQVSSSRFIFYFFSGPHNHTLTNTHIFSFVFVKRKGKKKSKRKHRVKSPQSVLINKLPLSSPVWCCTFRRIYTHIISSDLSAVYIWLYQTKIQIHHTPGIYPHQKILWASC